MIVFIKLVKRASILHEKFFIYKDQLTNTNHTILTILNNTPNKQYFRILNNTLQYNQPTNQTNKQTHRPTNTPYHSLTQYIHIHINTILLT